MAHFPRFVFTNEFYLEGSFLISQAELVFLRKIEENVEFLIAFNAQHSLKLKDIEVSLCVCLYICIFLFYVLHNMLL